MPSRDGDGWVDCTCGQRHWGIHGAAGIAIFNSEHRTLLLQHRADWTHSGATWALPGGAIDSHEAPALAAQREVLEELSIAQHAYSIVDEQVLFDHGLWKYHTVLAILNEPVVPQHNAESIATAWVELHEVQTYELHPSFAESWSQLRSSIEGIISKLAEE